jgi:hypothetical protein
MACNVIDARLEPCKEYIGGIQGIFLINFAWNDVITLAATGTNIGAVETIKDSAAVLKTGYYWELKGASSFDYTPTSDRNGGTTMYQANLNLNFKPSNNSATPMRDFADINTLLKGRWRIVVWDRNDNFWLMGEKFGCDGTTGAGSWGANLGDPRTYAITFSAEEANPPRPLNALTYAGLSTIFTVDSTPAV